MFTAVGWWVLTAGAGGLFTADGLMGFYCWDWWVFTAVAGGSLLLWLVGFYCVSW